MVLIFFIYGLAFFVLGITVYIYPKNGSQFKVAKSLWLIALFGIVHGINEWVDMFIMLRPVNIIPLKILRTLLLPLSFLFLIQFGINNIIDIKKKNPALKSITIILFISWGMITLASSQKFLLGDIFARYLLCLPGIVLTCYALMLHFPQIKDIKQGEIVRNSKIAVGALSFYGFLAGLIVPEAGFFPASILNYTAFSDGIGIPVQVFRAFCAVVITYAITRVLSIFELETVESLGRAHDELEERVAERAAKLRESEEFIYNILENVGEGFIVVDREMKIITANKSYLKSVGRTLENAIGKHCYELAHRINKPCHDAGGDCTVNHTFETGRPYSGLHTHYDADGNPIFVQTKSYPLHDTSGNIVSVIETINDVTDVKRLEKQLLHAQKMEAIGTLAGGIAHDFNNVLSAIIGYGSILQMKMKADDPLRLNVEHILESSNRAANLTHGLLTFSRKQAIKTSPISLNNIVSRFESLLTRIIGEDISFAIKLHESDPTILADSGQIEQVLMNLATNARDAMPSGGSLFLSTSCVELDEGFIKQHGYGEVGAYALISVTDSGCGMDGKTLNKIFEPFFTTKEVGRGTGLGLAIAYGIIKQHNGYINVYSEPGVGTTFKVYLPLIVSEVHETVMPRSQNFLCGSETILLAEDDDALRDMISGVLKEFGYTVIEAKDGQEAVRKFKENQAAVNLVLLDVIMPRMNGIAAAGEMRKNKPEAKILFQSGYPLDSIQQKGLLDDTDGLLTKPVSPQELLQKVRLILDKQ